MSKFIRQSFILLFLCMIASSALAADAADNGTWFGIVGRDGSLEPFALYKNDQWSNPWPSTWPDTKNDSDTPAIIPLRDITAARLQGNSLPLQWFVWLGSQATQNYIAAKTAYVKWYQWANTKGPKTITPLHAEDACYITLKTDYPTIDQGKTPDEGSDCSSSNSREDEVLPGPFIATSRSLATTPMMTVDIKTAEAFGLLSHIRKTADEAETLAIKGWLIETKKYTELNNQLSGMHVVPPKDHRVPAAERKKTRAKLNQVFKAAEKIAGKELYYVEAQRDYHNQKKGIYDLTYFKYWVAVENQKAVILQSTAEISDWDGKGHSVVFPHQIFSMNGRYYIIASREGYEWHDYMIAEYSPKSHSIREAFTAKGGDCF